MKKLFIILIVTPFLISCEKTFFEENLESTDPYTNLEYLWKECDEKYSYFDLKNINWNSKKAEYNAKLYYGMSDDSLFNVLGGMLSELKDGHVNLVSNFNLSFFNITHLGPSNFNWRVIEDNYLPPNYYNSGPFTHDFISNNEIGYIRFSSFTGTVDDNNLDFILNRYKNTKGLILDLRQNGGGAVVDVFNILSRFIDKTTLVYYSKIKNGSNHNDFSPAEPVYVSPHNGIRYTKKVTVLIDRGTYSAASFTSLATKAISNLTLIGDTTGGGLGLPNGGQLPNGWRYRFSITQALTLDQKPDYENGVPPDIHALFNWNDLSKDEVIDRAIQELQ